MDVQYFGANCFSISYKGSRIIIDDNLSELGGKSITKAEDVTLSTDGKENNKGRLNFSAPGEYEVSDIAIIGIPARSYMEEESDNHGSTMFKIMAGDQTLLITGHINAELKDSQLENIGIIDVMIVPVGGHGYTLDPTGALSLIKKVEPKIIIPSHYEDKELKYPVPQIGLNEALKDLAMEPKETVAKYKIKPSDLSDVTQLVILEKTK